jgi:hypothetical protein
MKKVVMMVWGALCLTLSSSATVWAAQEVPPPSSDKTLFVLYASSASMQLLQKEPVDLRARVNQWRDILRANGAQYRILTHPSQWASIASGAVIVLPSAYALSTAEQQAIEKRLAAGDSLLATGNPGTRTELGAAADGSFVSNWFGVPSATPELARRSEFVVVAGDTPLTYQLQAGTRLWVGKDTDYTRAALRSTGAAYATDWSRQVGQTGLLAYASNGVSRRVLLGLTEPSWDYASPQWKALTHMMLDWVSGRPVAYVGSWPAPYQAAMSFGVNASWRFENMPHLAQVFDRHGVPASFNLLSTDTTQYPRLLQQLQESGHDIATMGDRWVPFAGQTIDIQTQRVELGAAGLRVAQVGAVNWSGLRAPDGVTDTVTEQAVVQNGGGYLVDMGRMDSVMPQSVQQNRLTLLPNNLSLDFNEKKPRAEQAKLWQESLQEERARVQALRGYTYVGLDAAAMMPGNGLDDVLAHFLFDTRYQQTVWLAHADQVAHWWKARQRVALSSQLQGDELLLTVTVAEGPTIEFPLSVWLAAPAGKSHIRISQAAVPVRIEAQAEGMHTLVLTALPPGVHRLRLSFSASH